MESRGLKSKTIKKLWLPRTLEKCNFLRTENADLPVFGGDFFFLPVCLKNTCVKFVFKSPQMIVFGL